MSEKQIFCEDLYGDVKNMLNNTKRRLGINNVNNVKSDHDDETITSNSNFNNGKMNLDDAFCKRLVEYLETEIEKSFPNQTQLKGALTYELKKIIKTGNDKELVKVVEKIRDIILKEKIKFMDSVEKRVAKVLINKR